MVSSGIIRSFPRLSLGLGYVTHALLALSPLYSSCSSPEGSEQDFRVRLACLSHAASVRSEPGSNSSLFYSSCPDRDAAELASNQLGDPDPDVYRGSVTGDGARRSGLGRMKIDSGGRACLGAARPGRGYDQNSKSCQGPINIGSPRGFRAGRPSQEGRPGSWFSAAPGRGDRDMRITSS